MKELSNLDLGSFLLNIAVLTGWLLVGAVIIRFIITNIKNNWGEGSNN